MKSCVIFMVLFGLICPVYPQQRSCRNQAILINARDKHGNFIRGLRVGDFEVKVEGKGSNLLAANAGPGPGRVVVVLDTSASMDTVGKRQIARFTAGELVHSLSGNPQFALVVFGDHVLETVPFGHSRREIMSTVGRVTSSPYKDIPSKILDAMRYAGDLLTPPQVGDSVVLVSDGGVIGDHYSKTSLDALERAFWAKGIRIFVFELPVEYSPAFYGFLTEEQEGSGYEALDQLAKVTGGAIVIVRDTDGALLFFAAHNIEDRIANYYVLHLAGLPTSQQSAALELKLVDASGQKRKDAQLAFPKRLPLCPER
jgi:von Willebrand factor type A domain